jgi:hypothetical protein
VAAVTSAEMATAWAWWSGWFLGVGLTLSTRFPSMCFGLRRIQRFLKLEERQLEMRWCPELLTLHSFHYQQGQQVNFSCTIFFSVGGRGRKKSYDKLRTMDDFIQRSFFLWISG